MIERKIKELLEQYFSNISNWETKKIYFHNNYQLELIKFEYATTLGSPYLLEDSIKEICNKNSNYYVEPKLSYFVNTVLIKFRYFTRVK